MLPKSIRWRLPLSYAMIALLATLALGGVLLTSLREYYALREQDNLRSNAQLISDVVARMYEQQRPQNSINAQINTLSFISQTRIQLFDPAKALLIDSGNPSEKQMIAFNYDGAPSNGSVVYFRTMRLPMQPDSGGPPLFSTASAATPVGAASPLLWMADKLQQDSGKGLGFWAQGETSNPAVQGPPTADGTPPDRVWLDNPTVQAVQSLPPDQFTVAVAGSPYGVGLHRDLSFTIQSDQSVTVPIQDTQTQPIGSIEVSGGTAYGTEIIAGMTWALLRAGAIAALLGGGVGWFISRSMTAPLLALTNATSKMAQGELSTRVHIQRDDEFGLLARSFDDMAQRVDTTVTALRRFVADAAHQIHTPLTAVHADLELAGSEPDPARQQMFIARAMAQLKRMEALTNDLLDLSRLEARVVDDRRTVVDLVLLVRESSESFASRAEQAGVAFNVETSEPSIKARVNETQFRHAICNLLDNAIKFTPENGTITVGVCRDGDQVELSVNDTGIGITAEDLPNLFNRFHRGRNAAAYPGSGLGLAIIKAIVEGHQGEISVQSHAGDGTRFALRVPVGAS